MKIQIRSAQNVGKVWISRKKNFPAPFHTMSVHGPKNTKIQNSCFLGGPPPTCWFSISKTDVVAAAHFFVYCLVIGCITVHLFEDNRDFSSTWVGLQASCTLYSSMSILVWTWTFISHCVLPFCFGQQLFVSILELFGFV